MPPSVWETEAASWGGCIQMGALKLLGEKPPTPPVDVERNWNLALQQSPSNLVSILYSTGVKNLPPSFVAVVQKTILTLPFPVLFLGLFGGFLCHYDGKQQRSMDKELVVDLIFQFFLKVFETEPCLTEKDTLFSITVDSTS